MAIFSFDTYEDYVAFKGNGGKSPLNSLVYIKSTNQLVSTVKNVARDIPKQGDVLAVNTATNKIIYIDGSTFDSTALPADVSCAGVVFKVDGDKAWAVWRQADPNKYYYFYDSSTDLLKVDDLPKDWPVTRLGYKIGKSDIEASNNIKAPTAGSYHLFLDLQKWMFEENSSVYNQSFQTVHIFVTDSSKDAYWDNGIYGNWYAHTTLALHQMSANNYNIDSNVDSSAYWWANKGTLNFMFVNGQPTYMHDNVHDSYVERFGTYDDYMYQMEIKVPCTRGLIGRELSGREQTSRIYAHKTKGEITGALGAVEAAYSVGYSDVSSLAPGNWYIPNGKEIYYLLNDVDISLGRDIINKNLKQICPESLLVKCQDHWTGYWLSSQTNFGWTPTNTGYAEERQAIYGNPDVPANLLMATDVYWGIMSMTYKLPAACVFITDIDLTK